jgi:hypothetical protein
VIGTGILPYGQRPEHVLAFLDGVSASLSGEE